MVDDGFVHAQWLDPLVKQKKTIGDGSNRERRHLAGKFINYKNDTPAGSRRSRVHHE